MNVKMTVALAASAALVLSGCGAREDGDQNAAGSNCDPGITDTTITMGNSIPMSGPGAAYGAMAKTAKAYFDELNKDGGVEFGDGTKRTVELITLDDAYDPAKTVANTRELVEKHQVFNMVSVLGTSPNEAIYEYLNQKGVPNLFMSTGADVVLEKHKDQPWGMAWLPQYGWEAEIMAQHVLKVKPNAKVGLLYQNDGYGKTMQAGFAKAFEGTGARIVSAQGYEQAGGSVDAQISKLKASGADVFLDYGTGTWVTQSLKKAGDLGWKPLIIVGSGNNHAQLMQPAGVAATKDAISFNWLKDVNDPGWASDAGMKNWKAFVAKTSGIEANDGAAANGYTWAQLMVEALKGMEGCTRADLLEAHHSMKGAKADLLLPGVTVSTSDDYPYYINTVQMLKFDGKTWKPMGEPVNRQ